MPLFSFPASHPFPSFFYTWRLLIQFRSPSSQVLNHVGNLYNCNRFHHLYQGWETGLSRWASSKTLPPPVDCATTLYGNKQFTLWKIGSKFLFSSTLSYFLPLFPCRCGLLQFKLHWTTFLCRLSSGSFLHFWLFLFSLAPYCIAFLAFSCPGSFYSWGGAIAQL